MKTPQVLVAHNDEPAVAVDAVDWIVVPGTQESLFACRDMREDGTACHEWMLAHRPTRHMILHSVPTADMALGIGIVLWAAMSSDFRVAMLSNTNRDELIELVKAEPDFKRTLARVIEALIDMKE